MPVWLITFLVKYGPLILKIVLPLLWKLIGKPMNEEDQKEWDQVVRKGMTKEDIMDFQRQRIKPKVASGSIIVKANKPKVKSVDHKREK